MNTPISFEIAKLLKEKGFDKFCNYRYNDQGKLNSTKLGMYGKPNDYSNNYSAPTIAEVVMWLYEKNGIWISVEPFIKSDENNVHIYKIFKNVNLHTISRVSMGYNSPTESYEKAIKCCLENIINN